MALYFTIPNFLIPFLMMNKLKYLLVPTATRECLFPW